MKLDQLTAPRAIDAAPQPDERSLDSARDKQQVRKLAQEFEAMLLLKMLRQMRESTKVLGEESDGNSYGGETMTDTIDAELARHLAGQRTLGIADVLVQAFESRNAPSRRSASRDSVTREGGRGSGATVAVPNTVAPPPATPVAPPSATPVASKHAQPEMALPIDAPLTSRFGWRIDPMTRKTKFHGGVDVRAAYGQEVPAPTAGRVVFAGEQGSYGLTIVLEHEAGVRSRYAHLSSVNVLAGEAVEAGQVVGRVGSSGRSTGPHLHVELSVNGKRVDPETAAKRLAGRLDGPIEAY